MVRISAQSFNLCRCHCRRHNQDRAEDGHGECFEFTFIWLGKCQPGNPDWVRVINSWHGTLPLRFEPGVKLRPAAFQPFFRNGMRGPEFGEPNPTTPLPPSTGTLPGDGLFRPLVGKWTFADKNRQHVCWARIDRTKKKWAWSGKKAPAISFNSFVVSLCSVV